MTHHSVSGDAARDVDGAREHEQQVGQAVDVAQQHGIDGRLERDHAALGAAADGPRDVQRGAGRARRRRE